MKFRTVNGKIRHAVSPIGQARAETKACGGCGYHVCSCVKAARIVVKLGGRTLSASPGAVVPCRRRVTFVECDFVGSGAGITTGSVTAGSGGGGATGSAGRITTGVGAAGSGGSGAGISAGGGAVGDGTTVSVTVGGGATGRAGIGSPLFPEFWGLGRAPAPGYECQIRTDPATGHVSWRRADNA